MSTSSTDPGGPHALVAGEALVEEGRLTRIGAEDRAAILAEARARATELLERADVPAHRQADRRGSLEAIV